MEAARLTAALVDQAGSTVKLGKQAWTVSSLRLERASRRARRRVASTGAISFVQRTNSGAIGGTADMSPAR
jgi:hypothetical protein